MDAPQITNAAIFGHAAGTPGMAISPYGVGLGVGAPVPAASPSAAVAPGTFAPFEGINIARDFWSSASFGLIILILLVAYFDIRLLNR